MESKVEQLEKLIEPLLVQERAELVDLRFAKEGSRWVLRVFVDKEGGITLDDCEHVSDRISALLDETDPIQASYVLEVSSPGLDRIIKKKKDFEKFAGKTVKLRLKVPDAGQRNFKGALVGWREGGIALVVNGSERVFPHGLIDEVRLDYQDEV